MLPLNVQSRITGVPPWTMMAPPQPMPAPVSARLFSNTQCSITGEAPMLMMAAPCRPATGTAP